MQIRINREQTEDQEQGSQCVDSPALDLLSFNEVPLNQQLFSSKVQRQLQVYLRLFKIRLVEKV